MHDIDFIILIDIMYQTLFMIRKCVSKLCKISYMKKMQNM